MNFGDDGWKERKQVNEDRIKIPENVRCRHCDDMTDKIYEILYVHMARRWKPSYPGDKPYEHETHGIAHEIAQYLGVMKGKNIPEDFIRYSLISITGIENQDNIEWVDFDSLTFGLNKLI